MAFRLKQHESVSNGIKRIVRRQIDDVFAELASEDRSAVHDIRVHFKKVRACLHLAHDGLGDTLYRRENRCFRNAARPLTQVRDSEILIETLDRLVRRFAGQLDAENISVIRKELQRRYQATSKHGLDDEHAFADIARMLKSARNRLNGWPVQGSCWMLLSNGLKRGYRKNRDAFAEAKRHPTIENIHEWRKQAKYLWYQLLILKPAWPAGVKAWDKAFHKLTQTLGDDHDLAVLHQTLAADPDVFGKHLDALLPLIDRRRKELQRLGLALGERLYRDKPRDFIRRIEERWQKWRG